MMKERQRRVSTLLATFLLGSIFCIHGCATSSKERTQSSGPEEQWGIQISSIRLTEAGHLIDFRYKIVDPEKAKPLVDPGVKSYLVDQASGARLSVPDMPKVGSLRGKTRFPEANKVYYVLFGNTGQVVKPGSKVTVVIGGFKVEDLVVE